MINEVILDNNRIIEEWRRKLTSELRVAASVSYDKFRIKTRSTKNNINGSIFRIGVSMARHAIFYEKGVGRGRGISSGKTTPNPTYNPVMKRSVAILADQLAINEADLLAKALIK